MRRFPLVLSLILLGACATKPLYYWGNYESVTYRSMTEPGKTSPEQQIKLLEKDVSNARSEKLPLPPGFYAHLGYLYAEAGQVDLARNNFRLEEQKFPESTLLMDRFLQKKKTAK